MENQEQEYTKGFNSGYLIAKHEPELYTELGKSIEAKTDYLEGFVSGGKEYEHQKTMTKHIDKEKGKGLDIEIDR